MPYFIEPPTTLNQIFPCIRRIMLTRVSRVREIESSIPKGRPNLTQRCKRFATASASTQVAVLSWRYDGRLTLQTRYTLRRNTASIMKDLVLVMLKVI